MFHSSHGARFLLLFSISTPYRSNLCGRSLFLLCSNRSDLKAFQAKFHPKNVCSKVLLTHSVLATLSNVKRVQETSLNHRFLLLHFAVSAVSTSSRIKRCSCIINNKSSNFCSTFQQYSNYLNCRELRYECFYLSFL